MHQALRNSLDDLQSVHLQGKTKTGPVSPEDFSSRNGEGILDGVVCFGV